MGLSSSSLADSEDDAAFYDTFCAEEAASSSESIETEEADIASSEVDVVDPEVESSMGVAAAASCSADSESPSVAQLFQHFKQLEQTEAAQLVRDVERLLGHTVDSALGKGTSACAPCSTNCCVRPLCAWCGQRPSKCWHA